MPASGRIIKAIFDWLDRQPWWLEVCISIIALGGVHLADKHLDPRISVSFFYAIPVLLSAYTFGLPGGLAMALAAALSERLVLAAADTGMIFQLWNTAVRTGSLALMVVLFTAVRHAFKNEQTLARQDFLTGLVNRRGFEERAGIEIERARRTGAPLTVLYIDCDDFKRVNDTFGHAGGDKVLQTIASTMSQSLRSTDAIARMGGDEFAALLPDTNEPQARAAATNLHERVARSLATAGYKCSCSIGVAVFVAPPESVEQLIQHADSLMYAVKQDGKGSARVDVFLGPS